MADSSIYFDIAWAGTELGKLSFVYEYFLCIIDFGDLYVSPR